MAEKPACEAKCVYWGVGKMQLQLVMPEVNLYRLKLFALLYYEHICQRKGSEGEA